MTLPIPSAAPRASDMTPEEFRRCGVLVVDWIADYLAHPERVPVLANVRPGMVADAVGRQWNGQPATFDQILEDFNRQLAPGLTHWNHPSFFAYFGISASGPGILADLLSSALNQQAMLWRTSPAATELEAVALGWLRDLLGLPPAFEGVIYDTASISTLHALATARERVLPQVRQKGLAGCADVRIYCSEHAHSSVDKAVILLGFGHQALRKIACDDVFRMRPDSLADAIREDRARGIVPLAVVATVGTTATTSVDPVAAIGQICRDEQVWLHVDAAYAGVAAMVPGWEWTLDGCDVADSLVVNPHKWLFTPFDLSALFCRHMDALRAAFSLVPDYLETTDPPEARNLMDTGVQLGRRFRALKLWMILRFFGKEGLSAILAEHMRLARLFASWVEAEPGFELTAPTPVSVVCFRAIDKSIPAYSKIDALNQSILERVNRSGRMFLSHARIFGAISLRLAIGNIRTEESHVRAAWDELRNARAHELRASP
ncbi:MAG: aspartate aminotransferase family protein [Vicinamibacterales bacterium]